MFTFIALMGLGLFGACGSGSSGGVVVVVAGPALFNGVYCSVAFNGEDAVTDEATAAWGTIVGDGSTMTTGTGVTTRNRNQNLLPPVMNGAFPLEIDADRDFRWLLGATTITRGGISADGSTACLANIALAPAVFVMGRKSGVFSNSSLNGKYFVCAIGYDPDAAGGPDDFSVVGTMTFDGAGNAMSDLTVNANGVLIPTVPGVTYAVAADGSLTLTVAGTDPFSGSILAGGELVTLGGSTTAGQEPTIWYLIKSGAGLSTATLSGRYFAVGMEASTDANRPPEWTSTVLQMDFDGAGLLTIAGGTANEDGVVVPVSPGPGGIYTVAADGAFDLNLGTLVGGVSPSGNFVIFGGSTTAGEDPEVWLALR